VLLVEDRQEENKRRGIVNVLVIVWRAEVIWYRPGRANFRVTEFGYPTADKKQKGTKRRNRGYPRNGAWISTRIRGEPPSTLRFRREGKKRPVARRLSRH